MPIYQVSLNGLPKHRANLSTTGKIGLNMDDVRYAVDWLTRQGMPEPKVYVADVVWSEGAAEEIGGRTMQVYAGAGEISRAGVCNTIAHEYGHSTEKEAFTSEDLQAFRHVFALNTSGVLPDHVLIAVRGWSELIAESFAYLFGPPEVWSIPFKFKQHVGDFGFGPDATRGFESRHEALRQVFRDAWRRKGYPLRPPGEQVPQPPENAPEPKKPGASSFVDVAGHWAEADILECARTGLLQGDPDGRFRPDDKVTRAELATVLVRMKGRHDG